jgi:DNA replication protein DnaC
MSEIAEKPQLLLKHHLKQLKLPTFLAEYEKQAHECAQAGVDHVRYLLRLAELELIERERRMVERRIRAAKFPVVKALDSFDFTAIPSLNKMLVMELARSEYILRRENIIALGNSGTGKSHVALALGLAACQRGMSVGFTTAAGLVHQLMEARDEKRLLRLQTQLAAHKLLIVDELGYVPLSPTGAELLFEVFSQRYERGLSECLSLTINVREPLSPLICRSRIGLRSSAPNGLPVRCLTAASLTTSTSWK